MSNFNIFYRFESGHSRYAGDITAKTARLAFEAGKMAYPEIWNNSKMVEFYSQNSPPKDKRRKWNKVYPTTFGRRRW